MYYQAIRQMVQNLEAVDRWLDEAEKYAASKKFNIEVLLNSRLAPDMNPLIYQIQSACDYVKAAAGWLAGQKPPRHEDNETTLDEVRARIRKTVAFASSVSPEQYVACGRTENRAPLEARQGSWWRGLPHPNHHTERLFSPDDGLRHSPP